MSEVFFYFCELIKKTAHDGTIFRKNAYLCGNKSSEHDKTMRTAETPTRLRIWQFDVNGEED